MGKTLIRKFLREYKKRPIVKHNTPSIPIVDEYSIIDDKGNYVRFKRETIVIQKHFPSEHVKITGSEMLKRKMSYEVCDYISLNKGFIHFKEDVSFHQTTITGTMFIYRLIN